MQKIIGITGGIGSGKSLISKVLEHLGYKVYYADNAAKRILFSNPLVNEKIKDRWGSEVLSDGLIVKEKIAKIVFNNQYELDWLNSLIHPLVKVDFELWVKDQSIEQILFKEAAILFESGAYKEVDLVINVEAPEFLRIERVMKRDNVSESDVKARLTKQWNNKQRKEKSHFTIINDEKSLILPQLEYILTQI